MTEGQAARSTSSDRPGRLAIGRAPGRLWAAGAAVMCAVAALYLWQASRDATLLREANDLGAAGRYTAALRKAREVSRAPADADALLVQAYALQFLGRLPDASRAYARAARRDPNNWVIHQDWAVLLAQLGRRREAAREMNRAVALNPRLILPPGFTQRGSGP